MIGQVVSSDSYSNGRGVVFGIYVIIGGFSRFDVVFENGTKVDNLSEDLLRSDLWSILDEVKTSAEIEILLSNSHFYYSRMTEGCPPSYKAERASKLAQLRSMPQYAKLSPRDTNRFESEEELVICNLRIELQACFPDVKFTVRKVLDSCVTVCWEDGVPDDQVGYIIGKYQNGIIFGKCQNRIIQCPFHDVFGGVSYVVHDRHYSDAFVQYAIDRLRDKYSDHVLKNLSVEIFRNDQLSDICPKFWRNVKYAGLAGKLYGILAETEWKEVKDNKYDAC
ncbi:hypothetical protein Rin_00014250 [Candidatus Regiella insecticola 5.15]|uniref:Large polyvalent protein associated domain-containing protein n=1 Tax=Candidatus Regiella insecticola 5.15 TaxID=1005043 RepID=G2H045_9ENTR|nr:LPD29 domain-containing protein [Candidatus Regiella insecticola]EGY28640.1 hypothetical protein Rin_00014250 [Candidatus Regiella insecticola 5.15]